MLVVDALKGLLRPGGCLACGAPAAWPCCADCLPSELDTIGPWALAADPDLPLWMLGPYRDGLRTAVLAGKLDGQPAALAELGRRLGAALAAAGAGADLVTYVAARRAAGRPRDHAERIARGVGAALDVPVAGLLAPARGRDLGRARRAPRSPGRPPPTRPPPVARRRLAGGRVLLVDDLATTGATLAGAADALRLAGARRVEAAVLATGPAALAPARPRPPRPRPQPPRVPWLPPVPPSRPRPASSPVLSALLMEVALCGCDPFSCVESGQYDQRAVKEVSPHAEVIWQAGPCVPFGLRGPMGV
jgi:predicted amidophosphoribosyltransferase